MKPFQTLLFLAVIILIGGMAALYWGRSVQDATAPVEVQDEVVPGFSLGVDESSKAELEPGSYLVYQVTTVSDPGALDWANDDTQKTTLYRLKLGEQTSEVITSVVRGPENPGGLTTSVFGQDLLMHRFSMKDGKAMDGIVSLGGTVTQERSQQWGVLRSQNGRFEVSYTSPYDYYGSEEVPVYQAVVTDRQTGDQTTIKNLDLTGFEFRGRWAEPFWIDDTGEYLLAHEQFAGEGSNIVGLWEITVSTGEVRRLDTLFGLKDNTAVVPVPGERTLFVTRAEKKEDPCEVGGCYISAPPSRVSLIDLETNTEVTLFSSEDATYGKILLDPTDPNVFLVSSAEYASSWESYRLDDPPVFDGALELPEEVYVGEYADGYLVYQGQASSLFVFDKRTRTSQLVTNLPHDFVGIITVK